MINNVNAGAHMTDVPNKYIRAIKRHGVFVASTTDGKLSDRVSIQVTSGNYIWFVIDDKRVPLDALPDDVLPTVAHVLSQKSDEASIAFSDAICNIR